MRAGTKPVAGTSGSIWEEIISFPHPAKGFTPLWGVLERIGNLDCEFKNPGFESKYAVLSKKENLVVLYEFSFRKSRPSVMSSFQMCHNSFSSCLFLLCDETRVSLTICAWGLLLSPFSFWSCFHSGWIAAISRLIWRCVVWPMIRKSKGVSEFGLARGKGEILFEIPKHNRFH